MPKQLPGKAKELSKKEKIKQQKRSKELEQIYS